LDTSTTSTNKNRKKNTSSIMRTNCPARKTWHPLASPSMLLLLAAAAATDAAAAAGRRYCN
jgi:hypothetical protein